MAGSITLVEGLEHDYLNAWSTKKMFLEIIHEALEDGDPIEDVQVSVNRSKEPILHYKDYFLKKKANIAEAVIAAVKKDKSTRRKVMKIDALVDQYNNEFNKLDKKPDTLKKYEKAIERINYFLAAIEAIFPKRHKSDRLKLVRT